MNTDVWKLVKREQIEELKILFEEKKADPNLLEIGMNSTLLMTAVSLEKVKSVKLLLEYGADPNLQDVYGKSALHLLPEHQPIGWSSVKNKLKIAQILLQYKADINLLDYQGGSPLFYAAFYIKEQNFNLFEFYLKNGANPTLKSEKGESALEFANRTNSLAMMKILEKYTQ